MDSKSDFRRRGSLEFSLYSEVRTRVVSDRARRLLNSRSWRLTAGARCLNSWLRKGRRTAAFLSSRISGSSGFSDERMIAATFDLVEQSCLFDEEYYRQQLAARSIRAGDALSHFLSTGWKIGLNPNPFFDCDYYIARALRSNTPVDVNPLVHYILEGANRRFPTSRFFDTGYYVASYPDIVKSRLNPLAHFIQCGIFEDMVPVLLSGSSFVPERRVHSTSTSYSTTDSEHDIALFDLVLCLHSASRTGAPMLGLSILEHCQSLGLNVLVVLLNQGDLLPQLLQMTEVIDLSYVGDLEEHLKARIDNLIVQGRLSSATPVLLNSAENLALSHVFQSMAFRVTTLVHEFMDSYSRAEQRHLLENSDTIVFSSQASKAACGLLPEYQERRHIRVLAQGLTDEKFLSLDREEGRLFLQEHFGLSPDAFVILACGTAEPRKGFDLFVQTAIAALSRSAGPGDVHFIWVGGPLPNSEEFYALTKRDVVKSGLDSRVHFVEHQSDLRPYFAGADLFFLSSRQDPLPCVLHLAMAAGLATIAFEGSGGAAEIIAHGGGKTVAYANVDQAAAAIALYQTDRSLLSHDGESAREIVTSGYKMSDYVAELLDLAAITTAVIHNTDDVRQHYKEYWKKYQEEYGSVLQAYRPADTEAMLSFELEFGKFEDGMHVLDAGCGVCGPAIYFAKQKKLKIKGITLSEEQKAIADSLIEKDQLKADIDVEIADFHQVAEIFEANTFDRVMFMESFCHSPNPYAVLTGVRKVMKPNGLLVIKDYVMHDARREPELHKEQQKFARLSFDSYKYHMMYLGQLKYLLKLSGFSIVRCLINPHLGEEDLGPMLDFERTAELDWRKGMSEGFHVADCIMILAEPSLVSSSSLLHPKKTPNKLSALVNLTRINQWWDFKLSLPIGVACAYAFCNGLSAEVFQTQMALLLLCGTTAALFASLINDLSDLEQDKKVGKAKLMARLSPLQRGLAMLLSVILVCITGYLLRFNPIASLIYIAIAFVFVAYSVYPLRLKNRHFWGVSCIALGEHLLPTYLALVLLFPFAKYSQLLQWLAFAGIWSFAFGLRGIIWHQISDQDADRAAGCKTAATTYGAEWLNSFANKIVFPCEILGLLGMLMLLGKDGFAFALIALFLSALVEYLHVKYMQANLIIADAKENARFVLFDYYQLFFPVAMLLALSGNDYHYALLAVVYLLLFFSPVSRLVVTMAHLMRWRLMPALSASRLK